MKKQTLKIESIPAIIWGEKSDSVYIYVHGKMSSKEEAQGFNCDLTVLAGSEHWFYTKRQLAFLDGWIDRHMNTV